MHRLLALVALSGLASCGGGGGGSLTCAMLADPSNCWAKAAAGAAACVPATPGVLSTDRRSCTWSDGSLVTFDAPLPASTMELDHLSFDVTGPGCTWHFTDTFMNRMELTVGGKTEVSSLENPTIELACDDGSTYDTTISAFAACKGPSPSPAPTDGFDLEATSLQFTIAAAGVRAPLFTCSQ